MAVSFFTIVALLAATFMTQELILARQFTAECSKNQYGQSLCAVDAPDAQVQPPAGMTGHVGCTMSCTLDERCQHFNYREGPGFSYPCELFFGTPQTLNVWNGCKHFHATPTGVETTTAGVVVYTCAAGSDPCTLYGLESGFYAHVDPAKYVMCTSGPACVEMSCAFGSNWDQQLEQCVM